ncbi:MAG: hypothetical protein ACOVQY_13095 [Erythrobacter sp.]
MAMPLPGNSGRAGLIAALLLLAGCGAAPAKRPPEEAPALGLMTSLPLYWPADAALAEIAAGTAALPWQRRAIETRYRIVPLDTLSPIPALSPDSPETDPLAGLTRLAVIQPRGLSPADNVALDKWVRAGGRLLLVLDPVLTGEYAPPLGDPRRPVEAALIPPVVERWGLKVGFAVHETEEAYFGTDTLPGGAEVPLAYPGTIDLLPAGTKACTQPAGAIALCRIGKGAVTLIADAALFEHPELAGEGGAQIASVLAAVFGQ